MIPHVPEVLGNGDTGVDAGLTRHHGHVRGVRDDHRAATEPVAGARILERAELGDHIGHLIAALAAPDVHHDFGVAPLGDLLQQHRLAGTNPPGTAALLPRATGYSRSSTRSGVQALGGVEAFAVRPGTPDRPHTCKPNVDPGNRRGHRVRGIAPALAMCSTTPAVPQEPGSAAATQCRRRSIPAHHPPPRWRLRRPRE